MVNRNVMSRWEEITGIIKFCDVEISGVERFIQHNDFTFDILQQFQIVEDISSMRDIARWVSSILNTVTDDISRYKNSTEYYPSKSEIKFYENKYEDLIYRADKCRVYLDVILKDTNEGKRIFELVNSV